jgi:DnaJ-class molecular chaperone
MAAHGDEPPTDWYAQLDLGPDASAAEIDAAYRRLARALHPDSAPPHAVDVERLQHVLEAHSILSDPARRRDYDTLRGSGHAVRPTVDRVPCPVCRGTRTIASPCGRCRGAGYVYARTAWLGTPRRCDACGGDGRRTVPCGACGAAGYINSTRRAGPSFDE